MEPVRDAAPPSKPPYSEQWVGLVEEDEDTAIYHHTQLAVWEELEDGRAEAIFPTMLLGFDPATGLRVIHDFGSVKHEHCTLTVDAPLDGGDGGTTVPLKELPTTPTTPTKIGQSILKLTVSVPKSLLLSAGNPLVSATRVIRHRGVWTATGDAGLECAFEDGTRLRWYNSVLTFVPPTTDQSADACPAFPYVRMPGSASLLKITHAGTYAVEAVKHGDPVDLVYASNDSLVLEPLAVRYQKVAQVDKADFSSLPDMQQYRDATEVLRYVAKCPTQGHRVVAVCRKPMRFVAGTSQAGRHTVRIELGSRDDEDSRYDGAVCTNYPAERTKWTQFTNCNAVELTNQPGTDLGGVVILATQRKPAPGGARNGAKRTALDAALAPRPAVDATVCDKPLFIHEDRFVCGDRAHERAMREASSAVTKTVAETIATARARIPKSRAAPASASLGVPDAAPAHAPAPLGVTDAALALAEALKQCANALTAAAATRAVA